MTVSSITLRRALPRKAILALALLVAAALTLTAVPVAGAAGAPPPGAGTTVSGDARVTFDPATTSWTLATTKIERVVTLAADGRYLQTSLLDRETGRQLVQSGQSTEFRVRVDGVDVRGSSGGWVLDDHTTATRGDGALVLTVDLHRENLGVRRTYVVYPQTSFIEERTDVTNNGTATITLNDYSAVSMRVLGDDAGAMDLWTMSGDKTATKPYHQIRGPISLASGLQNPGGRGGNTNAEFLAVHDRVTGDGLVVTWDYTGNWVMNVGDSYGKILVEPRATIATPLEPGRTVQGPLGRVGLYHGDLDDLGNTVLDFTYRYLWDYTHDEYFPLIRYGGYGSDVQTVADKIDQLSYIGGDMVWIDDGWQDALGDWNDREGEPIAEYRAYASLHSQKLGLWLVPWGAEASSALAAEHPDWMVNPADRKGGLDTTLPGVTDHVRATINARQTEFGPFMLKTDFGADSGNLLKAQATWAILESFVNDNPDASLQLCSDGGGLLNLGTVGLSDLVVQQDGTATRSESYWTSLLYPTEKLVHTYGRAQIGAYQPSNRSQLGYHFTVAGDTSAGPEALEPIREDADLYRYLRSQGVLGRWVKVYRPTVSTGDATGILQKMSGDGARGYVTLPMDAFPAGSGTTLFLKGLEPERAYTISSQEGTVARDTRTGAQWMRDGILIDGFRNGEVIYLNLEDRPGVGTDVMAPSAPGSVTVAAAEHLGFEGIEVTWAAATDNRWVSSYEILKNGVPIWKVSKGQFWFDRNGTLDDVYAVRTVDGDGNVSDVTPADIAGSHPVTVVPSAHGTATASLTRALPGDVVTMTATPDEGYRLASWNSSPEVDLLDNTFTMPDGPVTLRPVFEPIAYVIEYDLAGGTVEGNPSSYTIESEAITLVAPTRTDNEFAGWTGTGLAEPSLVVTIPAGSTGDRSYAATWTMSQGPGPEPTEPGPEPTEPGPAQPTPEPSLSVKPASSLPRTGAAVAGCVLLAAVLTGAGVLLVRTGRGDADA